MMKTVRSIGQYCDLRQTPSLGENPSIREEFSILNSTVIYFDYKLFGFVYCSGVSLPNTL